MTTTRVEKDSMGELQVPESALYAAQTQRAVNNFPVSGQRMPEAFIRALILVKKAASRANLSLGELDAERANAICRACDELIEMEDLMGHFPVDVYQTGSGTSTNMNANEVISTVASSHSVEKVHPNDHVNYGQSSNDVIPTTIHVSAAIALQEDVLPSLRHLAATIAEKSHRVKDYCKTGRTHLMDAMPIRMDQSLSGWHAQIEQQISTLESLQPALQSLAQGGTAVGTGINAHPDFASAFNQELSTITDINFTPGTNLFALIASQDTAVSVSGALKSTAVSLMKIANDLRWMNSGPLAGLGEIALPALQPGSSIMPGKVNPVIPESVAMAAAQVIGNDTAITIGGQSGNFELNVMLPLIAHNLLNSLTLIANSAKILADNAIAGFTVNQENLEASLDRNPILVTALNPVIGYNAAAEIAKKAYKEGRPVVDVAEEMTDISREELKKLLDPRKLTGTAV
ncbi:class II fumarate hydratase [Alteromonas confluentis]|uniref:Fumarate hydratase class II n=1 Tax=Alteromonas confluentis TaxID=1656094 RepID=A0A1E7ZES3_9ALTE|nr:class II fumarate hydratase [Alteromonas confluentis]OFC72013.1 aspartate ammonia-lyase [Alteromonas confluentis]